jgi:D-threonate/D-erythronate kinase
VTRDPMRFGLVADDLTGACDSAVPFLAAGRVIVSFWPCRRQDDAACLAITTESRAEAPDVAYERSRTAVRSLRAAGAAVIFRKVDSQLRGHVAEDLGGALAEWDGQCLLAPALPEERRVTTDGIQRWPGGEIDLRRLVSGAGLERVIVRDAVTPGDLAEIAAEIAADSDRVMPAGTAGLAAHLPHAFGYDARPPQPRPGCAHPIAVVGTPAAAHQARVAQERGKTVVKLGPNETANFDQYDGLVLTGGETAARVLRSLGVEALELIGEASPRVPVARCVGGRRAGLAVALKAGAFGGPDAIDRALEVLARGA